MSVQYTDGTFSQNMPFDMAVEKFNRALARALYVGTEGQLDAIKSKSQVQEQLDEITARIEKIEAGPVKSENIIVPTRDEIIMMLRLQNMPPGVK